MKRPNNFNNFNISKKAKLDDSIENKLQDSEDTEDDTFVPSHSSESSDSESDDEMDIYNTRNVNNSITKVIINDMLSTVKSLNDLDL